MHLLQKQRQVHTLWAADARHARSSLTAHIRGWSGSTMTAVLPATAVLPSSAAQLTSCSAVLPQSSGARVKTKYAGRLDSGLREARP